MRLGDLSLCSCTGSYNHELVQGPALTRQLSEAMEQAQQHEANDARDPNKTSAKKPITVLPKKKR